MEKARFLKIPKPTKGRRFAISDIHGCSSTFKALLSSIKLNNKDQLFLLGDLINRGPGSDKVLNRVLKLKRKGIQVYILKGNHEDMVLKASKKSSDELMKTLKSLNSENLARGGRLIETYYQIMSDAYHYFVLDDYYLVHAGFDFSLKEPFEDSKSMMYIKEFKPNKSLLEKKRVVLGHSPKSLHEIISRIKSSHRKIHIDNGCINKNNPYRGNLIALDLDTNSITIQKNIEK
jgi:serine/threonine protein phosphatase 1